MKNFLNILKRWKLMMRNLRKISELSIIIQLALEITIYIRQFKLKYILNILCYFNYKMKCFYELYFHNIFIPLIILYFLMYNFNNLYINFIYFQVNRLM